MSEYCHDCGTTISDDIETLCSPCKKATGAVVECEMCGTLCDESQMNFVEHEGLDRQICNSCFHNAGF